jgi:hypothetical protein
MLYGSFVSTQIPHDLPELRQRFCQTEVFILLSSIPQSAFLDAVVGFFEGFIILEPEDNPSNKRIVKPQDLIII